MGNLDIVTVVVAGAISALLMGGYLWMKFSQSAVTYRHGSCPKCRQRLRFPAVKAGRAAECPRCRNRFTLVERTVGAAR
jgi:uncharacterized paraquat-inducible protein A